MANPDGYDFTFTPATASGERTSAIIRATAVTAGDGVDPNRNYPTTGLDNEGSTDDPPSDTYRGTVAPPSRRPGPLDRLMKAKVGFEFMVNYHYGRPNGCCTAVGYQSHTRAADDAIYRALAGTNAKPAIPGRAGGAGPVPRGLVAPVHEQRETTAHATRMEPSRSRRAGQRPTLRRGGPSDFLFQDSERDHEDLREEHPICPRRRRLRRPTRPTQSRTLDARHPTLRAPAVRGVLRRPSDGRR